MPSIRRSEILAVLALALLAGPLACGKRGEGRGPKGRPSTATSPVRGGTLRYATFVSVRTLDPAVAFDTESQPLLNLLFAGLVDYGPSGEIVPDLAERWELFDGGKAYRFFLRTGLTFHDGSPLDATDLQRSIERTLAPATPCPVASFYEPIEGVTAYRAGKAKAISGVVVESPHVLVIRLQKPDATFLPILALSPLRPVCKSGGRAYDDQFQQKACGAGPFRLAEWLPGQRIRVVRFPGWHEPGKPYLDAIELSENVSRVTQRLMVERGELDGIFNEFERPGAIHFRTHPEWSKYFTEMPSPDVYGEFMNVHMAPFDDVRVRRAVAMAVDRPHLAKYYEGWARVTDHVIPPGIPGYDPEFHGQKTDVQAARALMAEAGYAYDPKTGKGGYPQTITYWAGPGETAIRAGTLLQYDLSHIGLRIEIKETSFAQFLAVVGRPKEARMGYGAWLMDYADPSDFFEPTFSSAGIAPEESQNWAFYSTPELDALLARAHGEIDQEKRLAMYREADRIVCDDAPWAFAYNTMRIELVQPWLRGYKPHPVWNRVFRNAWIDPAAREVGHAGLVGHKVKRALGSLLGRLAP